MRSPTWYVAFHAVVRAESPLLHDTAVKVANEVAGDKHRAQLEELELKLAAAVDHVLELEHSAAVQRAVADFNVMRSRELELEHDDAATSNGGEQ